MLGATTLEEFGLALFIGLMSGAYSSIFIASPVLALLKEREPRYKALRKRIAERGAAHAGDTDTRAHLEAAFGEQARPIAEPAAVGAGRPAPEVTAPPNGLADHGRIRRTTPPATEKGKKR